MDELLIFAVDSFTGYASYLWDLITFNTDKVVWYENYFYGLILLSLIVWGLEIIFPWRKKQSIIRKDYWLDVFYMFFNFFIFDLIMFNVVKATTSRTFENAMGGVEKFAIIDLQQFPKWAQIIIFLIVLDFVQWFTHVMLHKFDFLWQFHKVHHSIIEMGYSGQLRYHWMENVFYTPMKYLALMFLGNVAPGNVFIVYMLAVFIGHLNHANIKVDYGLLKYIFNNPKMHIWHHSYDLPKEHPNGMNFGISLSIWDYIFKTAYIPSDGRDIKLGFPGMSKFPMTFAKQLIWPWRKKIK